MLWLIRNLSVRGFQRLDGICQLRHLFDVFAALVNLQQFVIRQLVVVDCERLVAFTHVVLRLTNKTAQHHPQIDVLQRLDVPGGAGLGQRASLCVAAK